MNQVGGPLTTVRPRSVVSPRQRAEPLPAASVAGGQRQAAGVGGQTGKAPFAEVLAGVMGGLRVSQHAQQRLRSAGLDAAALEAVGQAVERVAAKGGRESLVVYGDAAFVVNIPSRTLVTVIPATRMREQVFTNIDSAILVNPHDSTSGAGPAWEATGEGRVLP